MSEAEKDLNLEQIAEAMGMSTRWVRDQLDPKKGRGIEHRRPGNRIRMSPEQLEKFKSSFDVVTTPQSITTGRKRKSA